MLTIPLPVFGNFISKYIIRSILLPKSQLAVSGLKNIRLHSTIFVQIRANSWQKNLQRNLAKRNIQNLTKVTFFRPLLTKTLPESIKTIPKPHHFLTLFDEIFHFLCFCAVAKFRQISALAQP
jgi:hypothetical protein